MEKLIFREEQSFRQSFVPWVMLASILILLGGFGFAYYQQLYLGKPYGDEPMSNNSLIWSSIISFIVISSAFLFILRGTLFVEIWSDGIRFRFPPLIHKMKHIPLSGIASVEVGRYNPVLEFGGWGWRKRLLTKKMAYNVSGRIGIRVIKKNGSQVIFGTHKQDEMKRSVAKMMQPVGSKF